MPTTSHQRDLVKEYLTYIQSRKVSRVTRSKATEEISRRTGYRWAGKSWQIGCGIVATPICANGSRSFLAKAWRLHRSDGPSARRVVSFAS